MINGSEFSNHFINALLLPSEKEKDIETLEVLGALEKLENKRDPNQVVSIYRSTISDLRESGLDIMQQLKDNYEIESGRIALLHRIIEDSTEKFGSIATNCEEYVQVCKEMHEILNSFGNKDYPYALIHSLKQAIRDSNDEEVVVFIKQIIESHGEEFLAREVNPFLLAMEADDEGMINSFIEAGINPNLPKDHPPIVQALAGSHLDAAELLIRRGVELNVIDKASNTPLSLGLSLKSESLFKLMLEKGADPNYNLEQGLAVRLESCQFKFEVLEKLLYVEKPFPELMKKSGHLLLNKAIDFGNDRLIDIFLKDEKINKDLPDDFEENALYKAVENKDYHLVKSLIEAGADINLPSSYKEITPLFKAMAAGDEKMVDLLLEKGANPLKQGSAGGVSLFYSLKIIKRTDEKKFELYAQKFMNVNENVKSYFHHERLLKELGHAFEIDKTAKIKLTSANTVEDLPICKMPGMKEGGPMMLKRFGKMLDEKNGQEILSYEETKKIQEIIDISQEAKDPQAMMELLKKGEQFIVPTGYAAHTAFFLFWGGIVFHCDRSVGTEDKVMHLFEYDKEKVDVKTFEKMMNVQRDRGEYLQMVNAVENEMGCEPLNCSDSIEEGCLLEPQKVGNCAFASSVTVIDAILMMMAIEKEKVDLEKAEDKDLFFPIRGSQNKTVSLVRWMQADLLEKYLQETIFMKDPLFEPDHELIRVAFGLCWETNKKDPENKFAEKIKDLESKYLKSLNSNVEPQVEINFKMEGIHHKNIY